MQILIENNTVTAYITVNDIKSEDISLHKQRVKKAMQEVLGLDIPKGVSEQFTINLETDILPKDLRDYKRQDNTQLRNIEHYSFKFILEGFDIEAISTLDVASHMSIGYYSPHLYFTFNNCKIGCLQVDYSISELVLNNTVIDYLIKSDSYIKLIATNNSKVTLVSPYLYIKNDDIFSGIAFTMKTSSPYDNDGFSVKKLPINKKAVYARATFLSEIGIFSEIICKDSLVYAYNPLFEIYRTVDGRESLIEEDLVNEYQKIPTEYNYLPLADFLEYGNSKFRTIILRIDGII